MATGRIAFGGETSAVIFDNILNRAPVAPVRINPALPAKLEEIINTALEKDRDLRCQSAGELRSLREHFGEYPKPLDPQHSEQQQYPGDSSGKDPVPWSEVFS